MAHAQREAGGRLGVVLCAAAMLALLAWQAAPHGEEDRPGPVSLTSLAQRGHAEKERSGAAGAQTAADYCRWKWGPFTLEIEQS